MDIFIGGLPSTMRQKELQEIFEKYGEVSSVNLIMDHITRLNKGFGFVKMPDRNQAISAISALNGKEIDGRALIVNESKFKKGETKSPNKSKQTPPRKNNVENFESRSEKKPYFDRKKRKQGGEY